MNLPRPLLLLAAFVFLLAPARADSAGLPGYVVIPFKVVENDFIVRCTLNGQPINLKVDSGASLTIIDQYAFNRAIPKSEQVVPKGVQSKVTGNGVELSVFLAKNLMIGSVKLGDGPVALTDMSKRNVAARHYSRELAERGIDSVVIDGLLGLDILRTYNAVMDTARHVIYLNPDRSKRGGLLGDHMGSYGYKRIRMKMSHGVLEAPCTLQGKSGEIIVDTGAWLTVLDYKYARAAGVSLRPTLLKMGLSIGGQGATAVFLASPTQFKVGDYTYPVAPVSCQGLEFNVTGLLGPDLLEKAHAIIDFGNLSLFLK